jgi:Tfp pilus assembly protein PilZ
VYNKKIKKNNSKDKLIKLKTIDKNNNYKSYMTWLMNKNKNLE